MSFYSTQNPYNSSIFMSNKVKTPIQDWIDYSRFSLTGSGASITGPTGAASTIPGPTGPSYINSNIYGSFYSNTTQLVNGVNVPTVLAYDRISYSQGISITGATGPANHYSQIKVSEGGAYEVSFSVQLDQTQGGNHLAQIWARINGTSVPDSSSQITVQGPNGESIPYLSLILELNANDYVEFVMNGADSTVGAYFFPASGALGIPANPSIIVGAKMIGKVVGITGPSGPMPSLQAPTGAILFTPNGQSFTGSSNLIYNVPNEVVSISPGLSLNNSSMPTKWYSYSQTYTRTTIPLQLTFTFSNTSFLSNFKLFYTNSSTTNDLSVLTVQGIGGRLSGGIPVNNILISNLLVSTITGVSWSSTSPSVSPTTVIFATLSNGDGNSVYKVSVEVTNGSLVSIADNNVSPNIKTFAY